MANIFCNLFLFYAIAYNWTYVKKYLKEAFDHSVEFTFEKITKDDLPVWGKPLEFEEDWYKYVQYYKDSDVNKLENLIKKIPF